MPMNKANYSPDWPKKSRAKREASGWTCEGCGARQGDLTARAQRLGLEARVVLTVAHLNHDPRDNRPENLRAWCQRCHLTYDAQLHAMHAKATRARKKAAERRVCGQLSLFDGS